MNKRFFDIRDTCGDKPAFFCNGIIIRAANASPHYHAWDPSPASVTRGGVSFSYFRNDLSTTRLQQARAQGFTLKSGEAGASAAHPLTVLCSFPYDSGTEGRSDSGCGANNYYPADSGQCEKQGITTAQQWLDHFNKVPVFDFHRYHHQCGFNADTNGFATSLESRRRTDQGAELSSWKQNELSVAAWPAGIGEQLPLESFFYAVYPGQSGESGLHNAQFMQRDFYNQTKKIIPVIRITLGDGTEPRTVFSWHEGDQVVKENDIAFFSPTVLQATGNGGRTLTEEDYYYPKNLTVDVPAYTGMAPGDVLSVHWEGPRKTYTPAQKTVAAVGKLQFSIPRMEFIDAIGSTVNVSFTVRKGGGSDVQRSDVLPLQVEGQALTLPPPVAELGLRRVTVKYDGMTSHHRVSITFDGVTRHRTALKAGSDDAELVFDIPDSWVKENQGRRVLINYAVGDDHGRRFQFSQILRRVAGGGTTSGILGFLLRDD
ncbi:hypothetical protein [Erwinia typographi]|uniref:hypothetical protein n=1 Tax=Erwinia typographi TaxID=371042 RepID=UPI000690914F|nr:hypothetical protein [Erwinia typographi]